MAIETLIAFAGIVFLLAIVPGPNALLILHTSVTKGRTSALLNILGFTVGFFIHAFVSAKGLSLLMTQSAAAFNIFKWMGVIYLLWLGFSNIRCGMRMSRIEVDTRQSLQASQVGMLSASFLKGLLTNLLNPKIVLFYLSIFPQFVEATHILEQSLLLAGIQSLVVGSWFVVVILFTTKFKAWLSASKTSRWLNYISGSLFIGFGATLISVRA